MRSFDRLEPLGLLVLRGVLGIIMIAHGYSKVFGGFHQHAAYVSHLGMPWWMAFFSTAAEFGGGILLIVGLFTRFAALAICLEMAIVIWKVHWKNGLLAQGGYQFQLALAAIAFAIIFIGAGAISFDALREGGGGALRLRKKG